MAALLTRRIIGPFPDQELFELSPQGYLHPARPESFDSGAMSSVALPANAISKPPGRRVSVNPVTREGLFSRLAEARESPAGLSLILITDFSENRAAGSAKAVEPAAPSGRLVIVKAFVVS